MSAHEARVRASDEPQPARCDWPATNCAVMEAHQQRLAGSRREAVEAFLVPLRRCLTFVCMCGDEFDSVEEFTAHVEHVHTDDAELARIREAK